MGVVTGWAGLATPLTTTGISVPSNSDLDLVQKKLMRANGEYINYSTASPAGVRGRRTNVLYEELSEVKGEFRQSDIIQLPLRQWKLNPTG